MGRTTGAFFKHGVENRLWARKLLGISDTLRGATGQSFHVFKKRGVKAVTLGDARYVPITRIVRERVEEEDEVGLELELGPVLEHGIMILPLPVVVPPVVYNTTDTSTYLGGTGSILPSAGYGQFLIGAVGSLGSAYIWTADPAYWAGVSYNSTVWTSPTTLGQLLLAVNQADPSVWSGLARLFVQVLNGSGRLLTAVVSGADPDSDGLVRLWDSDLGIYRYWWVRTTEGGGVTARAGVAHGEGLAALAWLSAAKAGTLALTDADRQFLESWVLRRMTFEAAVEVLPAGGLTSVYTGGKDPTAHGWNYSRLRIGTTLEDTAKASTVTIRINTNESGNWHAETDHWHLEFSVVAGDLSAVLAQQEGPAFWTDGTQEHVWKPSTQGYCRITGPGFAQYDAGSDAPVYTSWGDEQENVLRYETYSSGQAGSGPALTQLTVCKTGSDSISSWNTYTGQSGGPYVAGTIANIADIVPQGIVTFDRVLTVAAAGVDVYYEPLTTEDLFKFPVYSWPDGTGTLVCFKDFSRGTAFDGPGTVTIDMASATQINIQDSKTLASLGRAAVISYDPEAVLLVREIQNNVSRNTKTYYRPSDGPSGGPPGFIYGVHGEVVLDTGPAANIPHTITMISHGIDGPTYLTGSGRPYGFGMGPASSSIISDVDTSPIELIVDAYLVTGTDIKDVTSSFGDWASLFTYEEDCIGKKFSSLFSYHEGAGWYHNTPSEFAFSGSFTQSPATHLYIPVGAS